MPRTLKFKRKYRRWLDADKQVQVEQMAMFGFSYRAMGEVILGIPAKSDTNEARAARHACMQYIHTTSIRLRQWRNCESVVAKNTAYRAAKTGRRKRRA